MADFVGLIAHGGAGGAIVETLLALTIVAIFLAVYLRERRSRSRSEDSEDSEV